MRLIESLPSCKALAKCPMPRPQQQPLLCAGLKGGRISQKVCSSPSFRYWAPSLSSLPSPAHVALGVPPSPHTHPNQCCTLLPPLLVQPHISFRAPHLPSKSDDGHKLRTCQVLDLANSKRNLCCQIPQETFRKLCFAGSSYGQLICGGGSSCLVVDVFTGAKLSPPQLPIVGDTYFYSGMLTSLLASHGIEEQTQEQLLIEEPEDQEPDPQQEDQQQAADFAPEETNPSEKARIKSAVPLQNSHLLICAASNLHSLEHSLLDWPVGSDSWSELQVDDARIDQIVEFKGQFIAMDGYYRLYTLSLLGLLKIATVWWDGMKECPFLRPWIVVCGDMLLMVDHYITLSFDGAPVIYKAYDLDMSSVPAVWVEVKKLESYSLFIGSDVRSPAFSCASPGRWAGRSNCLYYGHSALTLCSRGTALLGVPKHPWRTALSSYPSKSTLYALFPPLLLQPDVPFCSPRPFLDIASDAIARKRPCYDVVVPKRPCYVSDLAS
ncbi:LOW QUALITY PROTEIN: hypothetical protein U9M48_030107 [Paspalum notatum var. saurae]|uniref:KIB1-4 beta-propeller domain-containing protein n=1 Tax=Paspalum notatum var. saurae TaxID=547442 RepID=A0AAQ3X3E5_PASNO